MSLVAAVLAAGCSAEPPASTTPVLQTQTFDVGGSPWGVVADGERVWVSDAAGGRVVQLAPDGRPLRELPVVGSDLRAAGLVLVSGRLWVAQLSGAVSVLPVDAAGPVLRGAGQAEAADVTVEGDVAWLAGHGPGGALVQLDTRSLEARRQVTLPESPFQVELAGPDLWVAGLDARLFRLDARSGAVRSTFEAGRAPRGLAVTDETVWVSARDDGDLIGIDPTGKDAPRRVDVGGQPWPVAAEGSEVWVADLAGVLVRVDASTLRVTHRVPVPPGARGLALTPTAAWVTGADGTVTKVTRP